MGPLVEETLVRDIATLSDRVANIALERWCVVRKLQGNTCDEYASIAGIATAS